MSSIAFIINPISGGVRPEVARARAELASVVVDRHGDPAEVFVTERGGHARELTRAAVARGVRLVMAWGGDGTINEVASTLAFGDVPLGIVPAGSGNGLARQLGISTDPATAIGSAISTTPRAIDVGELGDRMFVNLAGIGLDAFIASRFNEHGGRRGLVGYARLSVGALMSYVPVSYTLTPDDEPTGFRVNAVMITIANSPEFGNGAVIAPGAKVDDGLLDLVVMEERSRFQTVLHLPKLFQGTVDRVPGCSMRKITRLAISSELPMLYHVDGEPVSGGTSLRARIHPGALYVAA